MKKDITIPQVEGVNVVVLYEEEQWVVHVLNQNDFDLTNVLINSKGYGVIDGEEKKTSVLRHMIELVPGQSAAAVETINEDVFCLNNEYWVSYFANGQMFDKKFVFVPDTISTDNLTTIPVIDKKGILHS